MLEDRVYKLIAKAPLALRTHFYMDDQPAAEPCPDCLQAIKRVLKLYRDSFALGLTPSQRRTLDKRLLYAANRLERFIAYDDNIGSLEGAKARQELFVAIARALDMNTQELQAALCEETFHINGDSMRYRSH
jgi:hypothetical protein